VARVRRQLSESVMRQVRHTHIYLFEARQQGGREGGMEKQHTHSFFPPFWGGVLTGDCLLRPVQDGRVDESTLGGYNG